MCTSQSLLAEVGFASNLHLAALPCVQACQTLHPRNWASSQEYDAELGGRGCGRVVIPKVQQHLYVFMHKYVQELQKSDQLTVNTQEADEGGLVVTRVQQHLSIHVCAGMRQSVQHYVQRMQPTDRVQDANESGLVVTCVEQHLSIQVCGGMCHSVQHYIHGMQPTDRIQADESGLVVTRVQHLSIHVCGGMC